MVDGVFGVFDGTEMIAEFGDDESADEYRREALELNTPEAFRRSAYDDLDIRELPDGFDSREYAQLHQLLAGLKASRARDRRSAAGNGSAQ